MKSLRRRLFIKFLLGYSVFFLLSLFFTYFYGGRRVQNYFYNSEGASLYREVTRLANYYSKEEFGSLSIGKITADMEGNIRSKSPEWALVSPQGKFLAFQAGEELKAEGLKDFDFTKNGERTYYTEDFQGILKETRLVAKAPIQRDFQKIAYLYLMVPVREIEQKKMEIMDVFFMAIAVIFFFSLSIFGVFYTYVYRPLRKITAGAIRYASGDYQAKIQVGGQDEMGYLAETLNFMAEEIQKSDDYQRQFIANVSHDFRSPRGHAGRHNSSGHGRKISGTTDYGNRSFEQTDTVYAEP